MPNIPACRTDSEKNLQYASDQFTSLTVFYNAKRQNGHDSWSENVWGDKSSV